MKHLVSIVLLVPLCVAPAFCTPAKRSAYHAPASKKQPSKKVGIQQHSMVLPPVTSAKKQPDDSPGQLIYEEPRSDFAASQPVVPNKPTSIRESLEHHQLSESEASPVVQDLSARPLAVPTSRLAPATKELSWVTDLTQEQSLQLADAIATYVAKQAPADSTVLILVPPPAVQAHNSLTPALNYFLRKSGFGLVDSNEQATNAHVLRYQVSRLDEGIWLQLQLNNAEVNRFYSLKTNDRLTADAPFCVREEK